ncbi:MAG: cysteine desulfurase NifS [Firmicutes bacterium]|nr:cysteine desulfurase NifS [Bacillota bacterium]
MMAKRKVYLDHGATTPLRKEVLDEMMPYLTNSFGNPSSIHSFGREARVAVEKARQQVADAIGASPNEIIFTSGGTEADNMAIQGVARALSSRGKHIITSAIEHHAVLDACQSLEKEGFSLTYLPVDKYGLVQLKDLEKAIRPETILVTIMFANNEIGTVQDVAGIGKICRSRGVYFNTDAVQAIGQLDVNVQEQNIDLLSMSAHKFYGPKGIGVLYKRQGVKLKPIIFGGGQERKFRPGTEYVAGIVGMGKAIELAVAEMETKTAKMRELRDYFVAGLLEIGGVTLNGHPQQRLPNNVNVSIHNAEGEALLLNLDMEGVAASSGSACTSGSLEPSHVLRAIGLKHEVAHGSLRLTLGKDTEREDIDYTLKVLKPIVARLRKITGTLVRE